MANSLVGVAADLHEAELSVAAAQQAVIDAFEGGKGTAEVRPLEEALARAQSKRSDLQDTYNYIMKKERSRGECAGRLTSLLYLSQWGPTFHPSDVPRLAFECNSKNELVGVTGALYVLRGWFASYIEGTDAAVERILRKLRTDPRHVNFVVMRYNRNEPGAVRKFPDNGLKLVYVETPQTAIQPHPEATILCELSVHAKFRNFTPPLDAVTRGRNAEDASTGEPLQLRRYVVSVAPYRHFFDAVPNPLQQLPIMEKVMYKVKEMIERSNNSNCQGAVVTPHQGRIVCLLQTEDPVEALQRAVKIFLSVRQDIETEAYCPMVGVHYGDVTSVMSGSCTIVGPILRSVRFHEIIALELGLGVYASEHVANEARRAGLQTKGSYMYGKGPVDIYVPNEFAVHDWKDIIATAKEKARADASSQESPLRSPGGLKKTVRKAHQPTSDEISAVPPKGLVAEEELRELYKRLGPDPSDGTLLRCNLDAWLHSQDNQGVPMNSSEVGDLLDRCQAVEDPVRLNFEQFCLFMYSREK
jgi:hypothetical protein